MIGRALTEEQIEVLGDKYLIGLFQELEQEVIADIARRVKKMDRYTETAEIMAKSMVEQGFSAEKTRADVMRMLRADKDYQNFVAENTKEHKAYIQQLINETYQKAKENGEELYNEAANMAWNNDLSMWDEQGVDLSKPNSMSQLVEAIHKQTNGEIRNLTRSTGFKSTKMGTVGIMNAYQHELDNALLKVATGTFSFDQAVNDCVERLSQSGLRSIDYASGKSYQLDTAARMCVRTGLSQLAGKIMEENLKSTGQDLVITSQHIGSRPEHAPWQNKVFSYSGKSKKYPDFFKETGYGTAGGLKGVNCTHDFYPFWEGASVIPEDIKEPPPITVNGREYTYYQATQKQRQMERNIRATKREIEAQRSIGGDTKELKRKLRKQHNDYVTFSADVGIRPKENRLKVAVGTSDLNKTKAKKQKGRASDYSARSISNENFPFNDKADFHVDIAGVDESVCQKAQLLCKEIVEKGASTGKEYAYAIDRYTGEPLAYEVGVDGQCMSQKFFQMFSDAADNSVIIMHNHTNNRGASYDDVNEILVNKKVYASIMACNNGNVYHAANQNKPFSGSSVYDIVFNMDEETVEKELQKRTDYHKIIENTGSYRNAVEETKCRMILEEYFGDVK